MKVQLTPLNSPAAPPAPAVAPSSSEPQLEALKLAASPTISLVHARLTPPAPGAPQLTTSYVPACAEPASARLPSSVHTAIQRLI